MYMYYVISLFYGIILFRKMKEIIKANEIPPWKMARWMGMLGIQYYYKLLFQRQIRFTLLI